MLKKLIVSLSTFGMLVMFGNALSESECKTDKAEMDAQIYSYTSIKVPTGKHKGQLLKKVSDDVKEKDFDCTAPCTSWELDSWHCSWTPGSWGNTLNAE